MIALFFLFTILVVSIVVIRIGAIALELTGLSHEIASFQAQSAFSGVGFTTAESEAIVTHPLRRRIIRIMILFGSAGLTSSIATFVLTFVGQSLESALWRAAILAAGLVLIALFARSKIIYRLMKRVIERGLKKWTSLRIQDYEQLLGLSKGYTISRIFVGKKSWLRDRAIKDLKLGLEGILILAIYRIVDGEPRFIGIPTPETVIREGDELICYAREKASAALSRRPVGARGDREHTDGVQEESRLSKIRQLRGGYE